MTGGELANLGGPSRPLTLLESARVLGGLRWVELEAFKMLGAFAVSPPGSGFGPGSGPGPEITQWASGSSLAHAWRATQLEELLPVAAGLPGAEECTTSPGLAAGQWLATLRAGLVGVDAGAAESVPEHYGQLAAAYELRASNAHASADGPVLRTLERLSGDVRSIAREYLRVGGTMVREA